MPLWNLDSSRNSHCETAWNSGEHDYNVYFRRFVSGSPCDTIVCSVEETSVTRRPRAPVSGMGAKAGALALFATPMTPCSVSAQSSRRTDGAPECRSYNCLV